MKLTDIMKNGRTAFTFEIFPPKKDMPIETIYKTLDGLQGLHPDFISVTYGAGGSAADTKTADIAEIIEKKYGIASAVHLTCLYNSKEDIDLICEQLKARGIENILALRGDRNPNTEREIQKDFAHASDLIAYLRTKGDFHIMGACYPEGHMEAASLDADIENLKKKVDAGADHLLSQLFFDNDAYFRFLDKARAAGIKALKSSKIKDVRGRGLMIGVEMDSEETAASVKTKMRNAGILVNVCHGKVIRIIPPLIFSMDQEKEWMKAFEASL